MKVKYFAWVRERIGRDEETVAPPADVTTVGDLIAWLTARGDEYAHAFDKPKVIRAAIDHRHAKADASIAGAREIAFFSADDGRLIAVSVPTTIRVQTDDFDTGAEIAALSAGRIDIGAVVSFSGVCRGGETAALTLEHYPGMAEAEIGRHVDEALSRWPLTGLTVIHRVGRIRPGENIVLVVTASAHRQAAFHAAEFLMDYLKANAPFWKHEETADGQRWVETHERDDTAAARWSKP